MHINFNITTTQELHDLEQLTLVDLVEEAAGKATILKKSRYIDSAINVSMFISRSGDVLVPCRLSDKNQLFKKDKNEEVYALSLFRMVFTPGRWTRTRILQSEGMHFNRRNVISVGSPRIDLLRRQYADHVAQREETALSASKPNVLWAPESATRDLAALAWECASAMEGLCTLRNLTAPEKGPDDPENLRDLFDADVVITDHGSIVFDAWALGKPVIFLTWMARDVVAKRYPGSVEDFLYKEGIGYHAHSVQDLIDVIQSSPSIGADVDDFMLSYIENYRGGPSAARIIDQLLQFGSHDDSSSVQPLFEKAEAVVAALPSSHRLPSAPVKPRASIQMLQLAALDGSLDTVEELVALMRRQGGMSKPMAQTVASVEIDLLFMQGLTGQVRNLASAIAVEHPQTAAYARLRLARQSGDVEAAIDACHDYFSAGGRSIAVWRLLAETLADIGEVETAQSILLSLTRESLTPELYLAASNAVDGPGTLSDYLLTIRACRDQLRKSLSPAVYNIGMLRAFARSSQFDRAVPLAIETALQMVEEGGLPRSSTPFTGWFSDSGFPIWLEPAEGLRWELRDPAVRRATAAFTDLSALVAEKALPLFISGVALRTVGSLEERAGAQGRFEFGVKSSADIGAVLNALRGSGLFEVRAPEPEAAERGFSLKHVNGVEIFLRLYQDDGDGTLSVTAHGVRTRLADFDLVERDFAGVRAPTPDNLDRYMHDVFGGALERRGGGYLFYGQDAVVESPERLIVALCNEIIQGSRRSDSARVNAAFPLLNELGYPEPWLAASGMRGKYSSDNLVEVLRSARFVIHIGDGVDAAYYVDLWLPYCKSVDPNTLVVIRSPHLFKYLLTHRPDLNMVFLKTAMDIEWLFENMPNLVSILYPSNVGNNVQVLRFKHLRHIFLGHGDSEKVASCHKFFRTYDEVWTAGRAHIDRFRNAGFDYSSIHFRVVGRPTLRDSILSAESEQSNSFLYLPTWEGHLIQQAYSSAGFCGDFLPSLVNICGYNAVAKFHPWTGKRLSALQNIETTLQRSLLNARIMIAERELLAADLMRNAAFLVADISSVVSDYIVTGRPIFLYQPANSLVETSTSAMAMEEYCYVFHTADHLEALVTRVIVDGDDFLKEARLRARQYFVDVKRTMDCAFESELRNVIAEFDGTERGAAKAPPSDPDVPQPSRPKVIGHRGAKALWAENSLWGFENAAKLAGLDGVEFDVHLTADGQLVVLHDPLLERTTTGSGPVAHRTLTEIRALSLRNPKRTAEGQSPDGQGDDEYLDARSVVPTLDEVLDILGPTALELHIELKNDALGRPYPGLAEKVLDCVRARGLVDRAILTSFSPEVLEEVHQLDGQIRLLGSVNYRSVEMLGGPERCLAQFERIPGCIVALDRQLAASLREVMGDAFDATKYGVWILNDPSQIAQAASDGVRQITTDRPDIAIEVLGVQ